ncbi:class I SAM-dependent methyltransferase [Aspergillus brunneoviolaceus CBS 621.78]|uniref:S-adenosyl-L-methionine-dependent methyltransferase n=1 Tax=Aspergillus brunneoviolaceus CBS 621.78 TaxID=1450534 RepID=A0ACD1GEL7_9EURO|nr:S-adenosyl-L-methionine-dependent methyltransferase [Aspergillus brunneoviolaceus CBS 621.78]RAH47760.1 S-adenosyl-L-methionine-dependent methyltransferase [Aspergillus brunneoviolaceus CBS 621.78]
MSEKPTYVLTRDYLDNIRLNLHHYLCVELFGYHTHPQIPLNGDNLRIADLGTGTGIWLQDIARRVPASAQLDALDVSFDAVPPKAWLPANMRTIEWDVKQDPPAELVGVYDVVHIRHFTLVLLDEEVGPVLERIYKLLKPGGYLQWTEVDMGSFRVESTEPSNPTAALNRLLKISEGHDPRLRPRWVPSLPAKAAAVGFHEVHVDARDAAPDLALPLHDCNLLINAIFARKFKNQQVAQVLEELMPEVERETKLGSCWAFTRHTVIGRKPEA